MSAAVMDSPTQSSPATPKQNIDDLVRQFGHFGIEAAEQFAGKLNGAAWLLRERELQQRTDRGQSLPNEQNGKCPSRRYSEPYRQSIRNEPNRGSMRFPIIKYS